MTRTQDNSHECPRCGEPVQPDDDFCPHCGELFLLQVPCRLHREKFAAGACIICAKPFCAECGARVGGKFLCHQHGGYEIYEENVRVFGSSDVVQVEFARDCLEKGGLHPVVFSRKASPLSMGAPDYTLFRASGEFDGHLINELKLMVPVQEVLDAEKKLKELDLIK
jgi:hypothetical protein